MLPVCIYILQIIFIEGLANAHTPETTRYISTEHTSSTEVLRHGDPRENYDWLEVYFARTRNSDLESVKYNHPEPPDFSHRFTIMEILIFIFIGLVAVFIIICFITQSCCKQNINNRRQGQRTGREMQVQTSCPVNNKRILPRDQNQCTDYDRFNSVVLAMHATHPPSYQEALAQTFAASTSSWSYHNDGYNYRGSADNECSGNGGGNDSGSGCVSGGGGDNGGVS